MMRWIVGSSLKFRFLVVGVAGYIFLLGRIEAIPEPL